MADTIFAKIIAGEIPADILYEDEHCIAIKDIAPQAPVHVLLIPRKPITMLSASTGEDQSLLGHLMLTAPKIAAQMGVADSFRLIVNNGEGAGQTVFHLHLHILGGAVFPEGMVR